MGRSGERWLRREERKGGPGRMRESEIKGKEDKEKRMKGARGGGGGMMKRRKG